MPLPRRLLLLLLLSSPAGAQPDSPTAPIAALNAALKAGMRPAPFAERAAALRPAVERAFDLPAILAASVGPRFAGFAEAAKAELLAVFTDFTVATWASNFDTDGGERFEVAAETRTSGDDQIVTTRIVPAAGEPTRLDYVMRRTPGGGPGGWKAVDILLNGTISRVAVQRSDFRSLVAAGDPAPLLASLRRRAEALAAGSRS